MKTRDQLMQEFMNYQVEILKKTGLDEQSWSEVIERQGVTMRKSYELGVDVNVISEEIKDYELNLTY